MVKQSKIKQLQTRWTTTDGQRIRDKVFSLFDKKAPRSEFEKVVELIEYSSHLSGYIDLRGFPFVGSYYLNGLEIPNADFSYATSVPGRNDSPTITISVCNFESARFDGIECQLELIGSGCLANASFIGSNLKRIEPDNDKILTGCIFDQANLAHSFFRGVNLSGCRFSGTNLAYVIFNTTTFDSPDFSDAKLKETLFRNCKIIGKPSFENAKLINVKFKDCDIDQSSLPKEIKDESKVMSCDMLKLGVKISSDEGSEYHKFHDIFIEGLGRSRKGEDGESYIYTFIGQNMSRTDIELFKEFYEELSFSNFGSD